MAFPTTPTNGQQYTVNGTTYQWNNANGTWDKVGTTSGTFGAIFNGNSNVTVAANSNVSVYIAGNATARAVFTSTGANIDGTASITGNANVGNLGTAGLIVAIGNVTGGNLNTAGALSVTGNANVGNIGTSGLIVATGNVTGGNLNTAGALSVTGNANVGNIGAATAVLTTAANVPLVQNGNSNISVDANSHVRISANGTANVVFVAANTRVGVGTNTPSSKLDISGSVAQNVVAVAASAIDCSLGNYFTKTATGALTWTFTNVPASRSFNAILVLTNGGVDVQTWPASVKWPGGTAPSLTASGVDLIAFVTDDGGTTWRGVLLMKDSK